MKGYRRKPTIQIESSHMEMGDFTVDPRCPDLYPDCGSSNSSFSYGLPTPTSTADFSAATSRRQSIASEVHGNESVIGRLPNFSNEGNITPLDTPSPFRPVFHSDPFSSTAQGYAPDTSPIGDHDRGVTELSTANGVCFLDPFSTQPSYSYTSATSELDISARQTAYQDDSGTIESRSIARPSMEWPHPFHDSLSESYDQAESTQITEAFGFGPSDLVDSDLYLGHGTAIEPAAERSPPQTVSPQDFFGPGPTSLIPTTPVRQPLAAPFRTPMIKSETQAWEAKVQDYSSPGSSYSVEESPTRRVPETQERRQSTSPLGPRRRKFESRGGKRKRMASVEISGGRRIVEVIDSSDKAHRCKVCHKAFERPEHHKRHDKSLQHNTSLRDQGYLPKEKDAITMFFCKVPKCGMGVTRHDNLKPHYQKTHLYSLYLRNKDGTFLRNKDGKKMRNRKRNRFVSKKEARLLGLGEYDTRPDEEEEDEFEDEDQKIEALSDTDE
ncbi:MAG: hypothetical protein LQ346_008668 [Caloplaca aetnensis]|nr:MAG: hypothetical protein LQ346_008668 [Caloplaca aetnensis]